MEKDLISNIEKQINSIKDIIQNLRYQWYNQKEKQEELKKIASDLRYYFEKFKPQVKNKVEKYKIIQIEVVVSFLEDTFYPYEYQDYNKNKQILQKIDDFRKSWPSLKAQANLIEKLEIPPELIQKLPKEVSDSLMEALRCFQNKCFTATTVMLGRTLEGAFFEKYCEIEKKEPTKDMMLFDLVEWAKEKIKLPNDIFKESNFQRWYRNVSAHYKKHLEFDEQDIRFIYTMLIKLLNHLFSS